MTSFFVSRVLLIYYQQFMFITYLINELRIIFYDLIGYLHDQLTTHIFLCRHAENDCGK